MPIPKVKRVFPAIFATVVLLLAGAILATDNPIADYVQQRYLSLRSRVAEFVPQPTPPPFMSTPLDLADTFATQPALPLAALSTPVLPSAQLNVIPTLSPVLSPTPMPTPTNAPPTPTPSVNLVSIQPSVLISGVEHEYQGWNNCGPTTLKMLLNYYGQKVTQKEIAAFTKPDPDDKNVSPNELAGYVDTVGMSALVRENGTLERLKLLLSNGLPVMIESGYVTPSGKEGWMGHYKLLIGYDDKQFTFMDSFEGPNRNITFAAAEADWRAFNWLYLIVYPNDKEQLVRAIVGNEMDDTTMYANSATRSRAEIEANPKDAFAYFNLGTSLNGLMQYKEAAAAFDQARVLGLPWRMMWYQFGPYIAYLQTGRDDEVISLADATLHVVDNLEESHYYKGMALRALGRGYDARQEFEAAVHYNKNDQVAQRALQESAN
jgi:tetratricopeptide (TPR) repeat protein